MNNIDQIFLEVLPKTKIYFDSIEEQFLYREKHNSKFNAFGVFWGFNVILLIFTYLPVLPAFLGNWDWLVEQKISVQIFEVTLDNFFIRWILLSAILSAIFFLITNQINKQIDKKKDKYSLSYKYLPFAFLYKSIKGLEVYLINGHYENARKSLKYLKWYYNDNFIKYRVNLKTESGEVDLSHHLQELAENNKWIEYSESTHRIITAFTKFNEKIYRRVEEKKEVDVALKVLEKLLVYEYLQLDKVTEDQIDSIRTNLKDVSKEILFNVSDSLNNISIVEESKEEELKSSISKIENFLERFIGLFNHKSILLTFFSWLILLSIIVIGIVYFGIKTAGLNLDSTLFIGAVSIVLIGAITLSASLFNKKKDTSIKKR